MDKNATDTGSTQIPADDPNRTILLLQPDSNSKLRHVAIVGDTYTILLTGEETCGRYSLIDMHVPPGGGPPPHRHDFEEMFSVLEGQVEFTFRGTKTIVRTGETVNIPANAPHFFHNSSGQNARLMCMCSPPGQEQFFMEVGIAVSSRTDPGPLLDDAGKKKQKELSLALASKYKTELLLPQ